MASNPVGWFEIHVQDMSRARAFYSRVFGFELEQLDMPEIEMWAFPMDHNINGAGGALVKQEGFPSGGNSVLVYFSCEDCAVEQGKVTHNGGKIVDEKSSIGEHGFVALVTDPEGNMIGLHSMK